MKATVCIVTFPLGEAGYTPLSNLVKLFSGLANRVYVVSGGAALDNLRSDANVRTIRVVHRVSSKLLMRIIDYMITQIKILSYAIIISKKVNLFVFFIGGELQLFPMLALKCLRKKVVLMPGGIATKVYLVRKDPLSKFLLLLTSLNFSLADKLILYSRTMTRQANLAKYHRKVMIVHEHFVDFEKFKIEKKIDERSNVVGYIGRLSEEKGILKLIRAMPLVLKKRIGVRFVICGNGSLTDDVKRIMKAESLEKIVELTGWVSHEDVPRCLNEMRLLVLPSLTEGLPNILLEAMACGTPVLAANVGVIPEIVENDETSFLLKSNDPQHIADRIAELLDRPKLLEKVSQNAYDWVRENFSEEKTLESWRRAFQELNCK